MSPSDEQSQAEQYDESKISTDPLDQEQDVADYPPDELQGADEYGTTSEEERYDEPLSERLEREEPDPLVDALEAEADDPNRPR